MSVIAIEFPPQDGSLRAEDLTKDHKPSLPEERKRIHAQGGQVSLAYLPHHKWVRDHNFWDPHDHKWVRDHSSWSPEPLKKVSVPVFIIVGPPHSPRAIAPALVVRTAAA